MSDNAAATELLEHGKVVVGSVLDKRLHGLVTVSEKQFGFMLEKGMIDAVFILT